MSRFRTLFSPATAIAILALMVSLSTGAVAAGLITGADIKDNSVTGADVKEGSLAKVPKAGNADRVGGVLVKRIRLIATGPVSGVTILQHKSLTLSASCTAGDVFVTASTSSGSAELSWEATDAGDDSSIDQIVDGFTSAGPVQLDYTNIGHSDIIGHLRYVATNGDMAIVELHEEDEVGGKSCVLTGTSIG